MSPFSNSAGKCPAPGKLPQRQYRPGVDLSIVGFGGMVLTGMGQDPASRLVAESIDRGVNYFDVAPSYGDGEAEANLGAALAPYRNRVFLAGKTLERSAAGARRELEQSLRRLRSGHLDLYQHHAVNKAADLEQIFAADGAMECFVRAREEGLVRHLGFSSHSVPIALALLDRFAFDSVLFPVNYVCYACGNFGPQVVAKARERGAACLAIKALAYTPWREGEARSSKCWYRPIEDRALALQALRFALSERICAVLPPGEERAYRMTLELAAQAGPLTPAERHVLLGSARGLKPILWTKKTRA